MAVLNETIVGVIGCGAALPANIQMYPDTSSDFVYIGLVGNRDMNYREMFELESYLTNIGLQNSLRVFADGHRWPPEETMNDAIEWVELESMKKGLQPTDTVFLNMLYKKRMQQALNIYNSGNTIESIHQYNSISRDFEGVLNADEIENTLISIEKSKSFKKELRDDERWKDREVDYRSKFVKAANQLAELDPVPDSLNQWWSVEAKRLLKIRDKEIPAQQLMAYRLINMLSAISIEWSQQKISEQKYYSARELIKLGVLLNPDSYYYYYKLAIIELLNENPDGAFLALDHAIKLGLDKNWLKSFDFNTIRDTDRFKKLITD
jgi:hypothetical protein